MWGNAGSRARTRRCSAGSGVGGGGIERGRTASPNRSGRREARRSISAEPGPWSLAWSGSCVSRRCRSRVRTCAGWRRCRARPRNACAGVCRRCSRGRAWRPGSWCSTTPSAWATATPTARPPGPVCSPCSARATGSGPGSATRIPATGRAAWRTRSAFAGRDPMVPMPSAEGFRASVRVWLDDIRVVAAECGFAATVKAVETVIDAGRTIDRAAIATCARRVLEGKGSSGGQDLKHHDEYMEDGHEHTRRPAAQARRRSGRQGHTRTGHDLGAQPAIDPQRAARRHRERDPGPARLPGQPVREGEREPGRIQTAAAARTGRLPPEQDA